MFYPASPSKKLSFSIVKVISFSILCSAFVMLTNDVQAKDSKPEDLTTVYKVVNSDGSVSFSDQPNERSETLMVPPIPTVPAIAPGNTNFTPQAPQEDKPYTRYNLLSILAPANGSAFYSGSGEVDVVLDIKPALIGGDQVQLFLDGQLIQSNNPLQSRLQTVTRGSHELRVKLVSPTGEVYKEAASTFTVHRPSIRN